MVRASNPKSELTDGTPDEERWRHFMEAVLEELHRKGEQFRDQVETLGRMLEENPPSRSDVVSRQPDDELKP